MIKATAERNIEMKWYRWIVLILPILACLGCRSSRSNLLMSSNNTVELARVQDEQGHVEIYELKMARSSGESSLVVRSERVKLRPDLGFTLKEIDKGLAKKKSLTPYRGLYVNRLKEGGSASRAGILPGDILVSLNGVELMYNEQFEHLLKNSIDPENEVVLGIIRGFDRQEHFEVKMIPDAKKVTIPSTKAIPLDRAPTGGRPYVGIFMGTLPAEWTERIYGEKRSTILISGVVVGSPAYHAGLRAGDRILSVDGRNFETASELKKWILERGPQGGAGRFEVYQKQGGSYSTEVYFSDFHTTTDIDIPLAFEFYQDTYRTRWYFGPFGMVVNYKGSYQKSGVRETNYSRRFSCLLGLFKCTWGPVKSSTQLLWFINFNSH